MPPRNQTSRIEREKETVTWMVTVYCRKHHDPRGERCRDCQELLDYTHQRLGHCKFGENKTVCAHCPVHCYKKEMQKKIIAVMRYSGPRILFYHPIAAFQHLWDKRKHPVHETN